MKIAVIDNYDSFIYTIIYYLESIADVEVFVMKNNAIDYATIEQSDCLLLSPGPGVPNEAGELMKIITQYHQSKPILGVCLGHQALYQFFGGTLQNIYPPLHGVTSEMTPIDTHPLWQNLHSPIYIAHYHSWVASSDKIPEVLRILSTSSHGYIMAFEHKQLPIVGIQFHPESILTPQGKQILKNWLKTLSNK